MEVSFPKLKGLPRRGKVLLLGLAGVVVAAGALYFFWPWRQIEVRPATLRLHAGTTYV